MSDYSELCGWLGGDKILLKEAHDSISSKLKQDLVICGLQPSRYGRIMLFEITERVLGYYLNSGVQLIGDCVSWGGHKTPIEYIQLTQIATGNRIKYKDIFSPYGYGCSRIYIGRSKLQYTDGSIGAWSAKSNIKFGSLPLDMPGIPKYTADIAREFGKSRKVLRSWVTHGKLHMVRSSALVTTWQQLVDASTNFYPTSVCSSVGFTMTPQNNGFHHISENWNHCMCIIGIDDDYKYPYACILNSWGDVHGEIIDFKTKKRWPKGTLRVRKPDIERMLDQGDSFAYSGYEGFPHQDLPGDFFDMI